MNKRETVENKIFSCCISCPNLQDNLLKDFKQEDFETLTNRNIYNAFKASNDNNMKLTVDNLYATLVTLNINSSIIQSMMNIMCDIEIEENYDKYKKIIKKSNASKKITEKLKKAQQDLKIGEDVKTVMDTLNIENLMNDVMPAQMSTNSQLIANALNEIDEMYSIENRKRMITTGLSKLDDCIVQLKHGELMIMTAEAGTGKTALMLNIMANNFMKGRNCIFVSIEMSFNEVYFRLANIIGNVNLAFTRGKFSSQGAIENETLELIKFGDMMINNKNWAIIDGKQLKYKTADEIVACCREMQRVKGWDKTDLIIIDYLQRIAPKDYKMNEYENINYSLTKLQDYCGKDNIALSLISNQNSEGKIKGSTNVTYDADMILSLTKDKESSAIVLEITKNRAGSLGKTKLIRRDNSLKYNEV